MKNFIYSEDELNNADRDEIVGSILSPQQSIVRMPQNQKLILKQMPFFADSTLDGILKK